jgi:PAS domain S-box-containing protein
MDERLLHTANWIAIGLAIVFAMLFAVVLFRLLKRTSSRRQKSDSEAGVNSSNEQQFMVAAFQGVIQRQKDQERELERLRRQEKERADLSQKINENITRNMPTGLMTIDRTGIITSSNPAAKEILQWMVLENMHFRQVLSTSTALCQMIDGCLETGRRFHRVETQVTTNSSQQKNLGISISPIESGRDGISGAVCLISDLTELAELQRQVRLKQGLAVLGEMSAGIAHEFKNSLATISGYAQMLDGEALPPLAGKNLQLIRRETTHLTSTINKFLNFAKPQQINRQSLDLSQLLRGSIEELQRDTRFGHVEYRFDGKARPYAGDEVLLRSVFTNLLLNASEAIQAEGRTGHVSCSLLDLVGDKTQTILVKISDDGSGIAAGDLEKIFVPFFTTKSNGSGLGLSIVQKIVLMHDGRIEVESQPGDGTCVSVYL